MNGGLKAREPRQKVMIPARMRGGETYMDVCIRNISSRGMMLQTASPPPPGSYIEILRGAYTVVGRIVWTRERRFGIHAADRIDINAIVNQTTRSGPRPANRERRSPERRISPADVAVRLERSRRLARAAEFGLLVAAGTAGAGLLATIAYEVMASPLHSIAAHLR